MRNARLLALGATLSLGASLTWVVAPAGARPIEPSRSLPVVRFADLAREGGVPGRVPDPGVLSAAQAGTTWFGGTVWAADSLRWEAIEGQLWTFDSGVGSSIVPPGGPAALSAPTRTWVNPHKAPGLHATMEGWIGFDNTYLPAMPFRRLGSDDPRWTADADQNGSPDICVGSAGGLAGLYSLWAGFFQSEAESLCYASGQGYGNFFPSTCVARSFDYLGGPVQLRFLYQNETEEDFDFTTVTVDTAEVGATSPIELFSFTGLAAGTASRMLQPGSELPRNLPGRITIRFCFSSDGAWSDEDDLNATRCGAFAVDNIHLQGGGIAHTATFESSDDGWMLVPPDPGPGGEWSSLHHLNDLPAPQTLCACSLVDSVLAFPDEDNGHSRWADNLAASPWIDLKAAGKNGYAGKVLRTDIYADLPLRNYIFAQFNLQWYPQLCGRTGKLITSDWTSNGFVYYFGGAPQCTGPEGMPSFQLDFSAVIPAGAEQVRMAVGVLSYCIWFSECTQIANTTPWYDNVGFGIFDPLDPPRIVSLESDRPQDNFPENGSLEMGAPGRVDRSGLDMSDHPPSGSSLGDTLVVQGSGDEIEVFVHFRVHPGPGVHRTRFNYWYYRHPSSPLEPGFRTARCDTAERGGVFPGRWMTAYHEEDPNFRGSDHDVDPEDIAPGGGTWRLKNDVFPDDLFTPGTRIDLFYSSVRTTGGSSYREPAAPGTFEMEILPSSMSAEGTWNCTLLVDAFDRGVPGALDAPLAAVLGTGPGNFEGTRWDRYDWNGGIYSQASLGRPFGTEYGAAVHQLFGYRVILWSTGSLSAPILNEADADMLIPWLTLLDSGTKGLYLTGDNLVFDGTKLGNGGESGRRLFTDLGGVTLRRYCNSFREPYCPDWSAPQDLTRCVALDPVTGALVAGQDRAVAHSGHGNGCLLRSFDVLDLHPTQAGIAAGDERYAGAVKTAEFASVAVDATSGGMNPYRMVTDGVSVHDRRDTGTQCTAADPATAVEERLREVLEFFGALEGGSPCAEPSVTGVGEGGEPAPPLRTALAGASPNPMTAGWPGRIRFTLAREGRVTIAIHDLQGRLVRTVFDAAAPAGENEAIWDGRDEAGTPVGSGVYFVRLEAGGEERSTRVVVLDRGRR